MVLIPLKLTTNLCPANPFFGVCPCRSIILALWSEFTIRVLMSVAMIVMMISLLLFACHFGQSKLLHNLTVIILPLLPYQWWIVSGIAVQIHCDLLITVTRLFGLPNSSYGKDRSIQQSVRPSLAAVSSRLNSGKRLGFLSLSNSSYLFFPPMLIDLFVVVVVLLLPYLIIIVDSLSLA